MKKKKGVRRKRNLKEDRERGQEAEGKIQLGKGEIATMKNDISVMHKSVGFISYRQIIIPGL